jgi:hypothetical protein
MVSVKINYIKTLCNESTLHRIITLYQSKHLNISQNLNTFVKTLHT